MTTDSERQYVIGLDLGGTNAVFGIVDKDAKIVAQTSVKTRQYDTAESFVNACTEALLPIIKQVGGIGHIHGMGAGAPNSNYHNGCIELAPNLCWAKDRKVPLADMFSERLGIKVKLTNDANAAALGEMKYGCAKGMKDFIVITLGTGVGSGIVANGQLLYGHDGFGGELGHVIMVRKNGRLCGCGRKGCLEAYCSATGVARTAMEMLETDSRPSLLRSLNPEEIDSYQVFKAANAGDEMAKEIFEFTGNMLGEACADFAAYSSPEAFIFFGGLCKAGDMLMNPIRKAYDRNVMDIYKGKAKFLFSTLNDAEAAVLGAAALGWTV
ncbi:MAG: ROK family protein [Bacteroidales bacterium]|nr:ROK family protein [Bacteroidales bacterium]MCM1147726.1 ROK family protein [Bacteroidales bacterium]MCM1206664.1 ROK family protein [Bacillota bacterium]MCM1510595.1 ROK family protein [Clostridium sp.]